VDHRPQQRLLRVAAWIGRQQEHLGDRVHAAGDARARDTGWTVTRSTGRLGFGSRTYRDPRFDQFRAQAQHESGLVGEPGSWVASILPGDNRSHPRIPMSTGRGSDGQSG
jgi:hypothetical protein